jgi:hypothetical protein
VGVMPCRRLNCDSILCSRYSNKYGYLCDTCFAELSNSNLFIEQFLETERQGDLSIGNRLDELNKEYSR